MPYTKLEQELLAQREAKKKKQDDKPKYKQLSIFENTDFERRNK